MATMASEEPSGVRRRPGRGRDAEAGERRGQGNKVVIENGVISAARSETGAVRNPFRRPQLTTTLVSLAIATCIVAIGVGLSIAVTGDERQDLPALIEEIAPVRGATQVPAQTQVFVDLLPGYEGVLVIDGLELETVNLDEVRGNATPGSQIVLPPTTIFEPGNATLTFDPSPSSTISEFSQGEHLVSVVYWKTIEGRGRARSFSWTFTVF